MAKLSGNLISGALGPYVFKTRLGKQIVSKRPAPGTMKQTAATKIAAKVFGKATSFAARFRKSLSIQYHGLFDSATINRLNGLFFLLLKNCREARSGHYHFIADSFSPIVNFEFNEKSKLSSMMKNMPAIQTVGNVLNVKIPAMTIPRDFKFPKNTVRIELIAALSLFRLHDGEMLEHAEIQSLILSKATKNTNAHEFQFDIPQGCLGIVTLFLDYFTANKLSWIPVKNRDFSPGRICATLVNPGIYQNMDNRRWIKMTQFD